MNHQATPEGMEKIEDFTASRRVLWIFARADESFARGGLSHGGDGLDAVSGGLRQ